MGQVYVGKNVIIEDGVKIRGPAYIGDNTIIREGSSIRPNVIIRGDVEVGADNSITESLLLNGCKIDDLVVIRKSMLGFNVRIGNLVSIGAGFNSDEYTLIGSNSHIMDNSVVISGVKIGKNCKIYYNSVCDRDITSGTFFGNHNIETPFHSVEKKWS